MVVQIMQLRFVYGYTYLALAQLPYGIEPTIYEFLNHFLTERKKQSFGSRYYY